MPVTPLHRLVAIARNGWSRSIGTPGRNQSEHVVAMARCAHLCTTLPKVATEMALNVLAYNMKRVIAILGVRPLLAALRA